MKNEVVLKMLIINLHSPLFLYLFFQDSIWHTILHSDQKFTSISLSSSLSFALIYTHFTRWQKKRIYIYIYNKHFWSTREDYTDHHYQTGLSCFWTSQQTHATIFCCVHLFFFHVILNVIWTSTHNQILRE